MYNLGLVSVSFRNYSVSDILNSMNNARLRYIEWGSDVHAPKDNSAKLKEIADLQKKYGIVCSSYGTYFKIGQTPISELEGYINAAKILGTDILRVWCGTKNSNEYSANEKSQLISECKNIAKIAEKNGVIVCLECHNGTFTETLEGALEIMQSVNFECFRMYWQPNQFREFEDNIKYAEMIAPYTKHIHVFKWRGQKKFSLNEGMEEWKAFLNCFGGVRTLLLEFMPDDKIESLKREADALRRIVGEE